MAALLKCLPIGRKPRLPGWHWHNFVLQSIRLREPVPPAPTQVGIHILSRRSCRNSPLRCPGQGRHSCNSEYPCIPCTYSASSVMALFGSLYTEMTAQGIDCMSDLHLKLSFQIPFGLFSSSASARPLHVCYLHSCQKRELPERTEKTDCSASPAIAPNEPTARQLAGASTS